MDITLCRAESCPKKQDCYRYTASPSTFQSYFVFPPFFEYGNKFECEYFIDGQTNPNEIEE